MKTKLMIVALMCCSSLSLAGDPGRAGTGISKKKLMKAPASAPTTAAAEPEEKTLVMGTGGLGTGAAKPSPKARGTPAVQPK